MREQTWILFFLHTVYFQFQFSQLTYLELYHDNQVSDTI